jgi:hypothetical protein
MLLSEREAKFKYCPLLKTHDDKLKFCLVSGCMMWRSGGEDKGFCGLAVSPLVLDRPAKAAPRDDRE